MIARFKTLDSSGHSVVEIDTESDMAVREAEAIVQRAFNNRSMVFNQESKERIARGDYKPGEHPNVLIVPAFQGG